MKATLMLADNSFMVTVRPLGLSVIEGGALKLKEDFLQKMASAVAEERGGTLIRAWCTHDGVYAEIEVEG